jgi:hypothetical protein
MAGLSGLLIFSHVLLRADRYGTALADDAFEPEFAGVAEDHRAIAVEGLGEADAVGGFTPTRAGVRRPVEQPAELGAALVEPLARMSPPSTARRSKA